MAALPFALVERVVSCAQGRSPVILTAVTFVCSPEPMLMSSSRWRRFGPKKSLEYQAVLWKVLTPSLVSAAAFTWAISTSS